MYNTSTSILFYENIKLKRAPKKEPFPISGRQNAGRLAGNVAKVAQKANIATSFLDAGISFAEGGMNFFEGDIDASVAQGAAGVISILVGVGLINAWNPLGIIALAAAGIIAGVIAALCEDSPFEVFVKNCPLSLRTTKKVIEITSTWTLPHENVKKYCDKSFRGKLEKENWFGDKNYERWHDFGSAIADFELMLTQ